MVRIDDESIPSLPLNGTKEASIGDEIFAFGNPQGLEGTVSKGIISSIRNDLSLIQIDAAISPGSSGGPVVNELGEVIGIAVSSLVSGQNLNFAVPSEHLQGLSRRYKAPVYAAGVVSVTDRDNEKLKGPVKSYRQTYAEIEYNEQSSKGIEAPSLMVARMVFDRQGNKIEDWHYDSGKFAWKYTYSFDDFGFMTRQSFELPNGKPFISEKNIDENFSGKLRLVHLAGSHVVQNNVFVYDSSGNLIESSIDLETGVMRTIYVYDRNGVEIESKEYLDNKPTKVRRYTYDFDQYGNWVKRYYTEYNSKWPSLGFVPTSNIYRELIYFDR